MTVIYKQGDLFLDQSEAIVNTVNCVGVMGKGVALEFKRRWPENFKQYKKLCGAKQLIPGKVFIFDRGSLLDQCNPRYLVNFPTKNHWREKSKLSYIDEGLDDFVKQLIKFDIKSVALPPLGCGNGGLPWDDVRALIEEKLSSVDGIDFIVYGSKSSASKPEYEIQTHKMTRERAILIKTIGEFEKFFGGYLTRISLQKIVYFLQAMGLSYQVEFTKNEHGPYSEELKSAFKSMENQGFIEGFEKHEVQATSSAFAEAEEFLSSEGGESDAKAQEFIDRLALLIEGYESPFGMELLSSVHYLVISENKSSTEEVVKSIQSWNDHKNDRFNPRSIEAAYDRLKEDEFLH